jgi:hypothetical protein
VYWIPNVKYDFVLCLPTIYNISNRQELTGVLTPCECPQISFSDYRVLVWSVVVSCYFRQQIKTRLGSVHTVQCNCGGRSLRAAATLSDYKEVWYVMIEHACGPTTRFSAEPKFRSSQKAKDSCGHQWSQS